MAGVGAEWPILLGGPAHWTVGLVATLIAVSSIIAADTFAFLGGKVTSHFLLSVKFDVLIAELHKFYFNLLLRVLLIEFAK